MNKKARPTSHSYFSQRLKLHFLDWGNEGAEHLLLIHGVQDHCHNWDWTSEALCQDYHVVVPDLRGHGDSGWSIGAGYTNLDYVYDIAQLVETEALNRVHLIGHSMGGTIASLFAGLYPERVASLTSLEGVGGFWYRQTAEVHPQARIREWITDMRNLAGRTPRKYPTLSHAFRRMQQSNPHLSKERARHLTTHGSNRNEDGTYTWKFDNYSHGRSPASLSHDDMTQIWEKITCPVLLLNAAEGFEHRTGQDDSLKHFKTARLIDVEQAGHWLHHDQLEVCLGHIRDFLAGVP